MKTLETTVKVNISNHFGTDGAALYVGTYKKYNSGSLFGEWLQLDTFEDGEEFFEVCRILHSDEKHPEFMFQDYSDIPEWAYSECLSVEYIDKLIEFAKLDEYDREAVCDLMEKGCDISEALENYGDNYGKFDSFKEFAEYYADEFMNIPEHLTCFIDYDKIEHSLDFDFFIGENGFVFLR